MSIQPTLTPEQQGRQCPTCETTGRRGYCAPRGCYCAHEDCPAYPNTPARRDPWADVVTLDKET